VIAVNSRRSRSRYALSDQEKDKMFTSKPSWYSRTKEAAIVSHSRRMSSTHIDFLTWCTLFETWPSYSLVCSLALPGVGSDTCFCQTFAIGTLQPWNREMEHDVLSSLSTIGRVVLMGWMARLRKQITLSIFEYQHLTVGRKPSSRTMFFPAAASLTCQTSRTWSLGLCRDM